MLQKEITLKEQSRIKWLKEGDRNLAFFHSVLKHWKKSSLLRHMEINGILIDNDDDITTHVLDFYKNLLSEQSKIPLDYSLVETWFLHWLLQKIILI